MIRKPIPKTIRQLVYQKCNGHCAYCGCELKYEDMQVDHIKAVATNDYRKWRNLSYMSDEELNSIENYMPSCRACNFYKSTWSLDTFRNNLSTMLYRNLASNFNYKLLKKYGLIKENIHEVKFYFEELKEQNK